jgi:hypothetical protein
MRIAPFQLKEGATSAFSAFCQFFSLASPSEDDILFILVARRYGRTKAKKTALALKWKCEAAIRAIDILAA